VLSQTSTLLFDATPLTTRQHHITFDNNTDSQSGKPLVSPPVARLLVSNLLPRLPASRHHRPEVSRSPTDTSQEPSLSEKSDVTRNPLSSSSESSPSNVWFVKSPRISNLISASNLLPSAPSKNPSRHTSSPSLRTPTFAPFSKLIEPQPHNKMLTNLTVPSVLPFNQVCHPSSLPSHLLTWRKKEDIQLARRLRGERS
jgi:hypothetical protein